MIIAFVGTPGSGKSYDAVVKIIANLKQGRKVYTNVDGLDDPIHQEMIRNHCGLDEIQWVGLLNFIKDDDLPRFWETAEPGSLIVLDELQRVFRNRDWNTQKNVDFANWASTHRHHGYDLILLTQFLDSIEKGVRELVEWTYRYRKINVFGQAFQKLTGSYMKAAYSGSDVSREPIQRITSRYNKKIFPLYSSYVAKDTKELGIMTTANALKRPVILIIPVVFGLFILLAMNSSLITKKGGFFGKSEALAKTVEKKSTVKESASGAEKVPSAGVVPVIEKGSSSPGGERVTEPGVRMAFQASAPVKDDSHSDQAWGATIYDAEDGSGRKLVYEGSNYVGWYKVHSE